MTEDRQSTPPLPPVWLMGMGYGVFGLTGGFLVLTLPQLLAAQGIPESRIGTITGICFSPGFWVFLLGPVLDIRFSRKFWASLFAVVAALTMTVAIALRAHLWMLETGLLVSYSAATMSANALGGWLAGLVPPDDHGGQFESQVSAWTQVATFLGNGVMALLAGEVLRRLPNMLAAVLLGALILLPALVFFWIPRPVDERRVAWSEAGAMFHEFATQLRELARLREVWLTLALFVLPTGSFALANQFVGVAAEFHAPAAFVSRMGGASLSIAGASACLLVPVLAKKIRPLALYLLIGVVGSLFTLMLLALPLHRGVFALGFLGESVFQAMSFTAAVAICLKVIGRENPLAGTLFGLLTAATVLPIVCMGALDGRMHASAGVHGMMSFDGGVSLAACAAMAVVLLAARRNARRGAGYPA